MLNQMIQGFETCSEKAHKIATPSNPAAPDKRTKVEELALVVESYSDWMAMLCRRLQDLGMDKASMPKPPAAAPPEPADASLPSADAVGG